MKKLVNITIKIVALVLCSLIFIEPAIEYYLATEKKAETEAVKGFNRMQRYLCKKCNAGMFNPPLLISSEFKSNNFLEKEKSYTFCFEYRGELKPKPQLILVNVVYQMFDSQVNYYLERDVLNHCKEAREQRAVN